MKDYELSILFHPDLEMNLDPAVEKVKSLIETNKGVITKEELDGKKRLAYEINGQEYAVFYYIDVQLPPEAPAKLESVMNISDEIIRAMLVKTDPRKARYEAYKLTRAAEEEADEATEGAVEVEEKSESTAEADAAEATDDTAEVADETKEEAEDNNTNAEEGEK